MKKSKFNLTYLNSTTGNAGYLIPFLLQPTLPNDTFRISLSSFIRAQPMVAPLMHEVKFYTQYWFVPNRIIWDDWESFITGGGDLSVAPAFPVLKAGTKFEVGSLGDYFGFPIGVDVGGISVLPFRAYAEIWNMRYRDEDLQGQVGISYSSGEDNLTSLRLLSPSWKRDYFTTARPFTQRGSDISVPVYPSNSEPIIHKHGYSFGLSLVANHQSAVKGWFAKVSWDNPSYYEFVVESNSLSNWNAPGSGSSASEIFNAALWDCLSKQGFFQDDDNYPRQTETLGFYDIFRSISGSGTINIGGVNRSYEFKDLPLVLHWEFKTDDVVSSSANNFRFTSQRQFLQPLSVIYNQYGYIELMHAQYNVNPPYPFYYNVSAVSNVRIRDLRASSALQRYAERSLQWGNRYEEFIQREFGIKPRDSRIQRPEYLGGGSGTLQISEVLQTAEGQDTGVGTMRGHGVAGISSRPIRFRAPEHGLIIGLLSIRPKPVYTQGVPREFLKKSRLDFFTPELANIGMQEVLQRELYFSKDNSDVIFGYSDRYAEYRYNQPKVTGEFRSTLSYWNMARQFDAAPVLNSSFIDMSSSAKAFYRPFASQSNHQYLMMLRNNIKAYRCVPKRAKNILK